MVDVDMSLMPLKFIGREAYLWTKGPYGLSKDPRPKKCPNTLWEEIKDFMKLEDGGVPKATWTSPILWKRSTCWKSFYKAYLMKDDVKIKVPNETPRL